MARKIGMGWRHLHFDYQLAQVLERLQQSIHPPVPVLPCSQHVQAAVTSGSLANKLCQQPAKSCVGPAFMLKMFQLTVGHTVALECELIFEPAPLSPRQH